jgi:hypothetical protein
MQARGAAKIASGMGPGTAHHRPTGTQPPTELKVGWNLSGREPEGVGARAGGLGRSSPPLVQVGEAPGASQANRLIVIGELPPSLRHHRRGRPRVIG